MMKVIFLKDAKYGDLGYVKEVVKGQEVNIKDIPVADSLISQGRCKRVEKTLDTKPKKSYENKMDDQSSKEVKEEEAPKVKTKKSKK